MCVLAALGWKETDSDAETSRAYVGALLIVDGVTELRNIRKLLSAKDPKK